MSSESYDHADKVESGDGCSGQAEMLARARTVGGHPDDRSQIPLPEVHRSLANPTPLGLLSFATGILLMSLMGVHSRGIQTPNVVYAVVSMFPGTCQFIAGIMSFVSGNTFGATVFPSYGAFNLSFALINFPGTGILAAYQDPTTGAMSPDFSQSIAMYMWAWLVISVIFTVAALRSTWVIIALFIFLNIELTLLAAGYMAGSESILVAGNSVGFVVSFCAFWAGCSGFWTGGMTPFTLPAFPIVKNEF